MAKRVWMAVLLYFLSPSLMAAECLKYEPEVSKLSGTISRKTFPGRPNYESMALGDASETVWVLHLTHPVCVAEGEGGINEAEKGVNTLQLEMKVDQFKIYKDKIGKKVTATGTLFHSHTGHHHTKVLLTVSDLD